MSSKGYTIKEVVIQLTSGVEIVAEVNSIEGIEFLLADLKSQSLDIVSPPIGATPPPEVPSNIPPKGNDSPEQRIETKASLNFGSLSAKKVIAFKDNIPQLLRPNVFSAASDAVLALVFSYETGLQRSSIEYEAFKGLYESQNIKSGSPLRMILSNLRKAGCLDKAKYSADKSVSLTAKGETKAIEILQGQCV